MKKTQRKTNSISRHTCWQSCGAGRLSPHGRKTDRSARVVWRYSVDLHSHKTATSLGIHVISTSLTQHRYITKGTRHLHLTHKAPPRHSVYTSSPLDSQHHFITQCTRHLHITHTAPLHHSVYTSSPHHSHSTASHSMVALTSRSSMIGDFRRLSVYFLKTS